MATSRYLFQSQLSSGRAMPLLLEPPAVEHQGDGAGVHRQGELPVLLGAEQLHQPLHVVLRGHRLGVPLEEGVEVEQEALAGEVQADVAAVAGDVHPVAPDPARDQLGPPGGRAPFLDLRGTLMLGNFWLNSASPWGTAVVLKGFWPSPQVLQRMVAGALARRRPFPRARGRPRPVRRRPRAGGGGRWWRSAGVRAGPSWAPLAHGHLGTMTSCSPFPAGPRRHNACGPGVRPLSARSRPPGQDR